MVNIFADAPASSLRLKWVVPGFDDPECAVLDTTSAEIYLTNQAAAGGIGATGQGHVTRLSLEGEVIERRWIDGLRNPMGLILRGDRLYVLDLNRIVVVDVKTGRQVEAYDAEDATYLDGVTINESTGDIFASDFMTSTIWRLRGGRLEMWLADPRLDHPDGMVAEADRLVVGAHGLWAGVRDSVGETGDDRKGHLLAVDYATKAITDIGNATPIAHHDGLISDGRNGYITSDFVHNCLLHVDRTGSVRPICRFQPLPNAQSPGYPPTRGPADIRYYPEQRLLLVPFVLSGEVAAFEYE